MTKAQLIEKRGLEWYENHKRNMRERSRQRFQEDPEYREKVLEQKRQNHIKHNEKRREYNRKRAVICRINCRDRNRLIAKGLIPDGKIVHHLKYHTNPDDETWIDDIVFMTQEEHSKWHYEHPEFRAIENVI